MIFKAVVLVCSMQFGGCLQLTDDPAILYDSKEECIARTHEIADDFKQRLLDAGFVGEAEFSGYCVDVTDETV